MQGIQFTKQTTALTRKILSAPRKIVQDSSELPDVLEAMWGGVPFFGFDLETSGLRCQFGDFIIGVGLCAPDGRAYYLPVAHQEVHDLFSRGRKMVNLPWEPVADLLRTLFGRGSKYPKPVGHHLKFDIPFCWSKGIQVPYSHDTMLMAFVQDANRSKRPHALRLKSPVRGRALSGEVLRVIPSELNHIEDWRRANKPALAAGTMTYANTPIELMGTYSCEDTQLTIAAWFELLRRAKPAHLKSYKVERDLGYVLMRMEQTGMPVSPKQLKVQQQRCVKELAAQDRAVRQAVGKKVEKGFNPGSDAQVRNLLYKTLRLPLPELKTDGGEPSVEAKVLVAMQDRHPAIPAILAHRQWEKAAQFVDSLLEKQHNGTVVSDIRQTNTRTSRLASSTPNLQQLPAKGFRRELIRSCFTPRPGFHLLSCDYSQIELRLLIHLMDDADLIREVWTGIDLHALNGSRLYNKRPDQITDDERKKTKTIVFGLIYGMGLNKLARETGMSPDEAKRFMDHFFAQFPLLRKVIDRLQEKCRECGGIWNHYGRFRPLQVSDDRKKDETRKSLNTWIQGTAAEVMKRGMISVDNYIQSSGVKSRIIMTVHDELLLEWWPDEAQVPFRVVDCMQEESSEFKVPLWVDIASTSGSWDTLKDWELSRGKPGNVLEGMRATMMEMVEQSSGVRPGPDSLERLPLARRRDGARLIMALDKIESTRLNLSKYPLLLGAVEKLWKVA